MYNLDEAIKHEEEVVKNQENNAKKYPRPDKNIKGSGKRYIAYIKCAEEHRQLVKWLKELRAYRKMYHKEHNDDCLKAESEEVNVDDKSRD